MTTIDRHIGLVRNKLGLNRLMQGLAVAIAVAIGVYFLALLAERLCLVVLPKSKWLLIAGSSSVGLFALAWGLVYRPSRRAAAVMIDEELKLHAKFSSALFFRTSNDPFARAAVLDAERTAQEVRPQTRFPVRYPARPLAWVGAALTAVLLLAWLMPTWDLFGAKKAAEKKAQLAQAAAVAHAQVERAVAEISLLPPSVAQSEEIKKLTSDLNQWNNDKAIAADPAKAERVAKNALNEAQAAAHKGGDDIKRVASYEGEMKSGQLQPTNEKGEIPDAENKMVKGDFTEAANDLEDLAKDFPDKSAEEQKKIEQQMIDLAQKLANSADDKEAQQQVQQQLQQAGVPPQQAQQMQQLMQQAANGDPAAQQKLQQMAQQLGQQVAKNGQPTPQQQQQIAAAIQAAQQIANQQANNGNMAQAAKAMAQAMAQAQAAQKAQGQGGQGQTPQQAAAGAQAKANAQAALNQAAGAMSAAAQMQQMQQAQAGASGAGQQQAGAQGPQAQAGGQGQQPGQGGQPQQGGQGQHGRQGGNQPGQGQMAQGNPQPGQGGQGGPAQGGVGGHTGDAGAVPFSSDPQMSSSPDNGTGEMIASFLIKDNHPDKGASHAIMQNVAASADKELTDEVETDRVSRQEADTARKYFATMKDDNK